MSVLFIPFHFGFFKISFSCLIVVARTSSTMLHESNMTGHLCLIPVLIGSAFRFFTIEGNVSCGFVVNSLFYVEVCSLFAHFLYIFWYKWILNFINKFF